jgi:hypothetical protein
MLVNVATLSRRGGKFRDFMTKRLSRDRFGTRPTGLSALVHGLQALDARIIGTKDRVDRSWSWSTCRRNERRTAPVAARATQRSCGDGRSGAAQT